MLDSHNGREEAMLPGEAPALPPRARNRDRGSQKSAGSNNERLRASEEMAAPPCPPLAEDINGTRAGRSESSASRNSNRLSLTLPIAPPNAPPMRPTPTSATMASHPSTPCDTPWLLSPADPTDLITAIAAQERRVLNLREDLHHAESDLARLKKQWANNEAHKNRVKPRHPESHRQAHIDTPEDPADGRSEAERRKALLLGQQATPTHGRRRVFTGSHTRTLSLLSPIKPTGDGFEAQEDPPSPEPELRRTESLRAPAKEHYSPSLNGYAPFVPTALSKRASWAPRSVNQQTTGVKQIAEDFKAGLWTFMEDLRQATVGEEPITGQGNYLRGVDGNMRHTSTSPRESDANQDTIRPSALPRTRATSYFDNDDTPTAASRYTDADDSSEKEKDDAETATPARHKSVSKATKHTKRFSLTPLTMDAYDDSEWSSWECPPAKSPRWSGSTMNGDLIAVPDEVTNSSTSPRKNASGSRLRNTSPGPDASASSPNKLEELLPPVLNKLTPSNLKKTASDFMKEWEKSLSPPATESGQQSRAD